MNRLYRETDQEQNEQWNAIRWLLNCIASAEMRHEER
jgi:hypothetical protein